MQGRQAPSIPGHETALGIWIWELLLVKKPSSLLHAQEKKKRVRKENVVLKLNHSMFQDLFTNLEGRKLNSAHICLLLCVPPETISTLHQLWSPHLIKFHVTQHHKQKEKQLLKHRCFLTGNESLAHVLEKNSSFILFILHFYCPPRITALGICQ